MEEIEKEKNSAEDNVPTTQRTTTRKTTITTPATIPTTTTRSYSTTTLNSSSKLDQAEQDKSSLSSLTEKPDEELIDDLLNAFLNDEELTEEQLKGLKKTLLKLKIKAGKLSEKIEALEKILETSGNITNESDKTDATSVLSVANCITVNIKLNI